MSHVSGIPVDIPRATEPGRKILFSRAVGSKLYYDTAFGEEFFIHLWHIPSAGISRTEDAVLFTWHMQHFNDNHTQQGA